MRLSSSSAVNELLPLVVRKSFFNHEFAAAVSPFWKRRRTQHQTLTQSEWLGGPPDPRPWLTHHHGPRTPPRNVENVTVTSVYCVVATIYYKAAPPTLARASTSAGPFRRIYVFYSFRACRWALAPRNFMQSKNDRSCRGPFPIADFSTFVVNAIRGNHQLSAKN